MSGKNQFPNIFNWQLTNPATGFLPTPYQPGSLPSGIVGGTMSATNSIYTQIVDVSKMDNIGLELSWTGTPSGTFLVMASNSGVNFSALTFNPALPNSGGSSGKFTIDLNQFPYKYMYLEYTNTSGSGILSVYGQNKDLN